MTRTVEAAFEAVRSGEGPHSLYTTLAPVYDRLMADVDRHFEDQAWIVNAELDDSTASILEVGCGLGGLLARLSGDGGEVVGIDRHPEVLRFARDRTDAPLVAGDAAALPVAGGFDAYVALEYLTADLHGDAAAEAFAEAYDALAPGGQLIVDAPEEPSAVLDDPWEGRAGRYRLRRSVTAGEVERDTATAAVHYEITDTEDDETVETTESLEIRLYDEEGLAELLEAAGFEDVEVGRKLGDDDALLATAVRPEE